MQFKSKANKSELTTKSFAFDRMAALYIKKALYAATYYYSGVYRVVVALPYHFTEIQKESFRAAINKHFPKQKIEAFIDKPKAAILAHGITDRSTPKNILTIDLSTKFVELCAVKVHEDREEVLRHHVSYSLGSDLYLQNIAQGIERKLVKQGKNVTIVNDPQKMHLLFNKLRKLLPKIKNDNSSALLISDSIIHPERLDETLTNRQIHKFTSGHTMSLIMLVGDFLLTPPELKIDEVILIGGLTNMSFIRKELEIITGLKIEIKVAPERIVAYGAAQMGYLLEKPIIEGNLTNTKVSKKSDL